METYRITKLTDIVTKVPEESLSELFEDLRSLRENYDSLSKMGKKLFVDGFVGMDFTPDGKGNISYRAVEDETL